MKAGSSIASTVPSPPGTQMRSQRSTFARSARPVNAMPSAAMSRPPSEATVIREFGVRLSTSWGPVKSSCVTRG